MKTIGIKLADGSFYPVLQEGTPQEVKLNLTTAHNNQTRVMVDLYRSAEGSMEDAEYVDTLQIDNLNEHPNGEPDLSFVVSLDENNELSAKMVDPETGATSNVTIELVSRTLEERLAAEEKQVPDFTISPTQDFLASDLKWDGDEEPASDELPDIDIPVEVADEEIVIDDETSVSEEEVMTEDSEESGEEPVIDDGNNSGAMAAVAFAAGAVGGGLLANALASGASEEDTDGEIAVEEDSLPDFNFDETPAEETSSEETASEENPLADFSLDDMPGEEPAEETAGEESLPDFDFEKETDGETAVEENSLPDFNFDETPAEETSSEETASEENPLADFSLDSMPEEETVTEEAVTEEAVPDFNIDEFPTDEEIQADTSIPDGAPTVEEDTLPDLNFNMTEDSAESISDTTDDFFNKQDDETSISWDTPVMDESPAEEAVAGSGLSFTGLYDKETELGDSSSEKDEVTRKTRIPVTICIICAVICIIAVLLILYVIPSKLNLRGKADAKARQTVEVPASDSIPEPEPVVEIPNPPAKEEEIVVIEKAEEVIPEQPAPPKVEPKVTKYKIRWGDTLWDIANTYYKNPWRYKYIARYNGITDPDYIISGTTIIIPEN